MIEENDPDFTARCVFFLNLIMNIEGEKEWT